MKFDNCIFSGTYSHWLIMIMGILMNYYSELENKNLLSEDMRAFHDKINTNSDNLGGVQMENKYITKEVFEQFEKRIDDKLDSLPDRMADKMDAKISKFEARQTKWFVGVGVGLIGVLLKVFGII